MALRFNEETCMMDTNICQQQVISDDTERSVFAISVRTLREASTVVADICTEHILLDKIRRIHKARMSKKALLLQTCESLLSELQNSKQAELEADTTRLPGLSVTELRRRCETAERRSTELSNEVHARRELIADLEKERAQLLSVKEELASHADSSSRSLLDFYRAATRIRWDFDTEPNKVIGFVAEPNHVATFDLDTNENSTFFIANKIWSMMLPHSNSRSDIRC